MHRPGSMKNSCLSGTGIALLSLLRLEHAGVLGWLVCFAHADGAHLVFGDLRDGVLCRDGELIGALAAAPVVRNEHRIRTDGADDGGAHGARAAAALYRDPVAFLDLEACSQTRVQLARRLG